GDVWFRAGGDDFEPLARFCCGRGSLSGPGEFPPKAGRRRGECSVSAPDAAQGWKRNARGSSRRPDRVQWETGHNWNFARYYRAEAGGNESQGTGGPVGQRDRRHFRSRPRSAHYLLEQGGRTGLWVERAGGAGDTGRVALQGRFAPTTGDSEGCP